MQFCLKLGYSVLLDVWQLLALRGIFDLVEPLALSCLEEPIWPARKEKVLSACNVRENVPTEELNLPSALWRQSSDEIDPVGGYGEVESKFRLRHLR